MIDAIPAGTRVALDTVTIIYFVERHARFGASARALFERIGRGDLTATLSTLALTELLVPALRADRRSDAAVLRHRLEHFRNLEILPVTASVATEAARLRARYGLRTPDAIHAASALVWGASGLVTNDLALRTLEGELRIWCFDA